MPRDFAGSRRPFLMTSAGDQMGLEIIITGETWKKTNLVVTIVPAVSGGNLEG